MEETNLFTFMYCAHCAEPIRMVLVPRTINGKWVGHKRCESCGVWYKIQRTENPETKEPMVFITSKQKIVEDYLERKEEDV